MNDTKTSERIFLTPKQLAERWQCSVGKLKRMRKKGNLPVCRIGRSARYRMETILEIESNQSEVLNDSQ